MLVCEYLENISRKALEEYPEIIQKYVRRRNGIYALYHRNKLYYVGLATNLRSRLSHHLRDRHAESWDSFSVYLTVNDCHLRELETLILRIIERTGNRMRGRFGNAQDIKRQFRQDFKRAQNNEMNDIFGPRCSASQEIKSKEHKRKGTEAVLAPFARKRFHIRMRYKGKNYIAYVRHNGSIVFAAESAEAERFKGKIFLSPSAAAKAITKTEMNGWTCWKYKSPSGEWLPLTKLRK